MNETERWVAVLHGYDWMVEREGKDDDADATEHFIADCGAGDDVEAIVKGIVADHNACLGIKNSETTVPELVAVLRELLVANRIPDPPGGYIYTLIDADSDEGHAAIARGRAVLARTGKKPAASSAGRAGT